eukprot:gene5212-18441_t
MGTGNQENTPSGNKHSNSCSNVNHHTNSGSTKGRDRRSTAEHPNSTSSMGPRGGGTGPPGLPGGPGGKDPRSTVEHPSSTSSLGPRGGSAGLGGSGRRSHSPKGSAGINGRCSPSIFTPASFQGSGGVGIQAHHGGVGLAPQTAGGRYPNSGGGRQMDYGQCSNQTNRGSKASYYAHDTSNQAQGGGKAPHFAHGTINQAHERGKAPHFAHGSSNQAHEGGKAPNFAHDTSNQAHGGGKAPHFAHGSSNQTHEGGKAPHFAHDTSNQAQGGGKAPYFINGTLPQRSSDRQASRSVGAPSAPNNSFADGYGAPNGSDGRFTRPPPANSPGSSDRYGRAMAAALGSIANQRSRVGSVSSPSPAPVGGGGTHSSHVQTAHVDVDDPNVFKAPKFPQPAMTSRPRPHLVLYRTLEEPRSRGSRARAPPQAPARPQDAPIARKIRRGPRPLPTPADPRVESSEGSPEPPFDAKTCIQLGLTCDVISNRLPMTIRKRLEAATTLDCLVTVGTAAMTIRKRLRLRHRE